MDLLPSAEQEEIVASVDALLTSELPMASVRRLFEERSSIDRGIWSTCASLGWFGLGLAESVGGVGYGLAEEALLFREIGRHLTPGPFLPTVLGARVAAAAGADVGAGILDGSAVVGLAELHGGTCTATEVTGVVDLYDCAEVDLVLVATPENAALLEVSRVHGVEPAACLDPGTRLATGRLEGVRPIAFVEATSDPLFARGAVLSAAALSGIAGAARDLAAEHARTRVQFGKPIGVHQAVKHACTDMAVRAEAAACQTFMAALTLDRGLTDAAFQVASAKVVAADAALRNARANIQIHGGMGFTWEHDAHLLLKRAHVLSRIFGDRHHHLAELISLPAAP